MGGDPEDYEYVGMDFDPPVDIVANAKSHGAEGEFVSESDEIDAALSRSLDTDGPFVVDVLIKD